jgi:hypothetical protein
MPVDVKYNRSHHAGPDAASRVAYRERYSGRSFPDANARGEVKPDHIVPSTRDRTITGVFSRSQNRGNGPVRFGPSQAEPIREGQTLLTKEGD